MLVSCSIVALRVMSSTQSLHGTTLLFTSLILVAEARQHPSLPTLGDDFHQAGACWPAEQQCQDAFTHELLKNHAAVLKAQS